MCIRDRSYDALVLDDELKDALQNVMDKDSLDVETLQGFTLNTHSGTGIQYLSLIHISEARQMMKDAI